MESLFTSFKSVTPNHKEVMLCGSSGLRRVIEAVLRYERALMEAKREVSRQSAAGAEWRNALKIQSQEQSARPLDGCSVLDVEVFQGLKFLRGT